MILYILEKGERWDESSLDVFPQFKAKLETLLNKPMSIEEIRKTVKDLGEDVGDGGFNLPERISFSLKEAPFNLSFIKSRLFGVSARLIFTL